MLLGLLIFKPDHASGRSSSPIYLGTTCNKQVIMLTGDTPRETDVKTWRPQLFLSATQREALQSLAKT